MRRVWAALALAVIAGLALPAVAAPPVTETVTEQGLTDTFVDFFTCEEDGLYEITTTFNHIEHVTEFPDGRVHFTFTDTGTFDAVALDPSNLDASGHFTVWGGFNDNGRTVNGTFTFNVNGQYEDGTRVSTHFVEHFNVIPSGTEFSFARCHD
jgi:hypothetical protein